MINQIIHGDCFEVMPNLKADSIDLICTDPPYGLKFMGKDWDHGVPSIAFWKEAKGSKTRSASNGFWGDTHFSPFGSGY